MDTERLLSDTAGGEATASDSGTGLPDLSCLHKWQVNKKYLIGVAVLVAFCILFSNFGAQAGKISIRLPDIRPDHAEQYLCMSHRVKKDQRGEFIVGFNPKADSSRVHHMLMYGCEREPGVMRRDSPNLVWDCSSMHSSSEEEEQQQQGMGRSSFERGPLCKGREQVLYGWALDAPALRMPDGVGFKIGGPDSGIDYLVLQVHYGHYEAFQQLPGLTDNSGLVLDVRADTPNSGITKRAGVLLLISLGYVKPGPSKHEIWCDIRDSIEIHPFRFRVHTHKLGTRVIGAKISSGQSSTLINEKSFNVDKNSIVGSGDPQKPQMFYPVNDNDLTLTRGDKVYASCEFNNTKAKVIQIGSTGDDEMCNFYMMYWTNGQKLLDDSTCYSQNPPESYINSIIDRYREAVF